MPAMDTHFGIESFPLRGSAIHLAPGDGAAVLRGDALKTFRQEVREGALLGAFFLAEAHDVHPGTWERHPTGDEILAMLGGALAVEIADGPRRRTTVLIAGHGLVVPRGAWHRLELRAPGLLLALTPLEGTQTRRDDAVAGIG